MATTIKNETNEYGKPLPPTEAGAVERVVRRLAKVTTIQVGAQTVLAVPEGFRVESVKRFADEYLTRPERRRGTAVLGDLASFILHTKRFLDEGSALFADTDRDSPSLTCVLDYHPEGQAADTEPRFGTHRGVYRFPLSEEWKVWTGVNGKENAMSQADFAEFLEDHIGDVISDPTKPGERARAFLEEQGIKSGFAPAYRLIDVSRGLTIRADVRVSSAVNLQTGEAQINFVEEHHDGDGGPVKIPPAFLLAIPLFEGGDAYEIPVRLRYRFAGGQARFWVDLHGTDRVFDFAVREACARAEKETGIPLFFGKPEA